MPRFCILKLSAWLYAGNTSNMKSATHRKIEILLLNAKDFKVGGLIVVIIEGMIQTQP